MDHVRAVLHAKDRYAVLSLGSEVPIMLDRDGYSTSIKRATRRATSGCAARLHEGRSEDPSAVFERSSVKFHIFILCKVITIIYTCVQQ
jgi:hypothetical protein